jgi:hypothetical protein
MMFSMRGNCGAAEPGHTSLQQGSTFGAVAIRSLAPAAGILKTDLRRDHRLAGKPSCRVPISPGAVAYTSVH